MMKLVVQYTYYSPRLFMRLRGNAVIKVILDELCGATILLNFGTIKNIGKFNINWHMICDA